MAKQIVAQYDQIHQFEPLMPAAEKLGPLLALAAELTKAAGVLNGFAAPSAHCELRALLRSMNSYYTNRIEGEHTRPADIERALQDDFSKNADLARKQRLAVAHIRTEKHGEDALEQQGPRAREWLYSTQGLCDLHHRLFAELKPEDLSLVDGSLMVPGELRQQQVAVGRHEAPAFAAVPRFLDRWADVYQGVRSGEASIVAALASHHRLAWVHPFLDGNGRVARLHTHLLFHVLGLTKGLWSPLRGFARTETQYKALLQAADEHRKNDYDGRGNLTQSGLIDWISYALTVCIDQASFMREMLDIGDMKGRIEATLIFEESSIRAGVRREALLPLHYLFSAPIQLTRAEFKSMTGLGERTATDLLSSLLKRGYLSTDSPHGKVRFAIPPHALKFYFPGLWPEAQHDAELEQRSSALSGHAQRRAKG